MNGDGPIAFVERSYTLPRSDKDSVVIRFEPDVNGGAGPVFGCRVLKT